MWGQLSTTCIDVLKQPNGELLVAVYHNQLRTMASETVDPIDWSHPPPAWAVRSESPMHSVNQCNLSGTRTCNRSMRENHLANAATQGINNCYKQGMAIVTLSVFQSDDQTDTMFGGVGLAITVISRFHDLLPVSQQQTSCLTSISAAVSCYLITFSTIFLLRIQRLVVQSQP